VRSSLPLTPQNGLFSTNIIPSFRASMDVAGKTSKTNFIDSRNIISSDALKRESKTTYYNEN
jgi:hypothetical protein